MRLHAYRDKNRSGHVELVGGGDHPWTIDLVTVIAAAILVIGFAGALVANLVLSTGPLLTSPRSARKSLRCV